MATPPSRSERLASLFVRTHGGVKLGLDYMASLLEALGNPERRFLSVHVAGTNGKGSTCALIEAALRHRGLRTALYTSPHLVRVNERIQIQGLPLSDDDLHRLLDLVEHAAAPLPRPPSFFETLTAIAFLAFAENHVQVAVVEVGLGGRLDCTNVLTPLLSVITRIDFDHMDYLGDTLAQIASEKAGILKPGRPAVLAAQPEEALHVLRRVASEKNCPLVEAPNHTRISQRKQDLSGQHLLLETPSADYGRIRLPLLGAFQLESLATAIPAIEETLRQLGIPDDPDSLRAALASASWPARCQVLSRSPPLLLDVAHNPGGARALTHTLRELFGRHAKGVWVVGQMRDKDNPGFFHEIAPHASHCLCVAVDLPRAQHPDILATHARKAGIPATSLSLPEARLQLPTLAAQAAFGCIAGSVYLAGNWLEGHTDAGEQL